MAWCSAIVPSFWEPFLNTGKSVLISESQWLRATEQMITSDRTMTKICPESPGNFWKLRSKRSKDSWMCTMCVAAPEARPALQATLKFTASIASVAS